MGNRTKQINLIKEKKNKIVMAYCALDKNNSSCFDFLSNSYPDGSISKIFATYGNTNGQKIKNNEDISIYFAEKLVKKLYGTKYIPMELYSANFVESENECKQQKYICIANKDRVDRKRKYDFETLKKYIENNDIVLLNVKERKIGHNLTETLTRQTQKEYQNNAFDLLLLTMPTLSTVGKTQNSIIMRELKNRNFELYSEVVKFDKKIAQSMFLYETSKEQLLLNDAIEEFESTIWTLPIDEIKHNIGDIENIKTKADNIGKLMSKNSKILKNIEFAK